MSVREQLARHVPLLHGSGFDADGARFTTPTQTGFACYRGARSENGEWRGVLVGIADNEEQSARFLSGETVRLRKR